VSRLDGTRVLVTGATSGLGLAMAEALVDAGAPNAEPAPQQEGGRPGLARPPALRFSRTAPLRGGLVRR